MAWTSDMPGYVGPPTPEQEQELDRWWASPPRVSSSPVGVDSTPVAQRPVEIVCAACGAQTIIAPTALARLCAACLADLDATEARIRAELSALDDEEEQALARWEAYLDSLSDEVRQRWIDASSRRDALDARIARLMRQRPGVNPHIATQLAQARAERDRLRASWEKTRANPANPISSVIRAEEHRRAEMMKREQRRAHWRIALQEIEFARNDERPF